MIIQIKDKKDKRSPKETIIFALNDKLKKNISPARIQQIQENCLFLELNKQKIGVRITDNFEIGDNERDFIREGIKEIYANHVEIVKLPVEYNIINESIEYEPEKETNLYTNNLYIEFSKLLTAYEFKYEQEKKYFNWFAKFNVIIDLVVNKLIFVGNVFYIRGICIEYASVFQSIVDQGGFAIELKSDTGKFTHIFTSNQKQKNINQEENNGQLCIDNGFRKSGTGS